MATRLRGHDWSATPLGPIDSWPTSLRVATRLLVNSRHPMFIWWGPDHIQLYNDAYRETMGPEKHPSALGRSGRETWAEIWDVIGPQIAQVMNGGPATWHEDQLVPVTRHGSLEAVWWTYSFSPIDDDAAPNGVGGVMVVCRDVTAEHLAREAVAASEARHRLLIESLAQAVWETDPEGVVVADSPSWRAYTGQTPEAWLGYGWLDAVHPDDRAYAERQWREAVAARELINAEFRLRSPDGGWRWTNVRAAPVLDEAGMIEKWAGMNIDVHARKCTEAALRESEEKYRSLFESMVEGFYYAEAIFDEDGHCIDLFYREENPAAVRITGRSLAGRRLSEIADYEQHWYDIFGHTAKTGEAQRLERYAAPDNIWYEFFVFKPRNAHGNEVAVVFNDVTARHEAQRALRESEERQAYLLRLSDALRPLSDQAEIQETAMRLLGEQLGASRAQYYVADETGEYLSSTGGYTDGVPAAIGSFRLIEFGKYAYDGFHAGETQVVCDATTDSRISPKVLESYKAVGFMAFVGVPFVQRGRFLGTVAVHQAEPRQWTESERIMIEETAQRAGTAIEQARAEAALGESERWLQTLMQGVPQLVWRASAPGIWTWASPQWTEYTGQAESDSHGEGWQEPLHPDDREQAREHWASAGVSGRLEVDYRIFYAAEQRYRWFQTRATPVRSADGEIVEWLGTSTDVDDLRGMQDRQRVLVAELQHRVRNILTIVRSVFERTVEADGPLDAMIERFRGRLDNLARTQVIATQSAGGQVDLRALIVDELLGVGVAEGPDIILDGPDVAMDSQTGEAISLAIHELTTNAVKYGALKITGASLTVRWSTELIYGGERRLDLTWVEQGVPAVPLKPARHGFGSELIEQALPYRLGAETKLEFRAGGVRCTISVPLPEEPASDAKEDR